MLTLAVSATALLTVGAGGSWAKRKPVIHKAPVRILAGTWTGTYSGGYNGTFTLHWTQSGSKLTGTIKLTSPAGSFSADGSVTGSTIKFGDVSAGATYTGTVSGTGKSMSMSGTYQALPKGGPWSATKTS
jgi:hypothetical protein